MPLTPATLPRHELIGLPVRVVSASNPDLVGIAGEVVMETTRTLSIEGSEGGSPSEGQTQSGDERGVSRVWQVPKADATFEFSLDGAVDASERSASDRDGTDETVLVDGERLVARPARRTERTGDSKWR